MRKFVLSICAILLLSVQFVLAQSQIKGMVTGAEGEPLSGVTVLVKGTQRGEVTDNSGRYAISSVPSNGVLVFSYLGYETQEVPVLNKSTIDVQMTVSATDIDDVMVVAFGTAKKEAFTGSAAVVKADDLAKRQTSNISKALEGQVAGVQMVSSTGQPGSAGSIRIRGIGSISASSAPLYVVDGVPYDGDLAALNNMDVESMTVLKDAASNALYGARGANGVILITTKRGKLGNAVVNLDMKWGSNSRAVPEYDVMTDPGQYMETLYSARRNYYLGQGASEAAAHANANLYLTHPNGDLYGYNPYTVPGGEDVIGVNGKLNPNAMLGRLTSDGFWLQPDNWNNAAYNNSLRQEYNLNVSGASDKMNYFFSLGYLNDESYIVNSGYERISARLKADYQAKKWLKIGANASYTNGKSQNPTMDETGSNNMFYVTRNMAPVFPLFLRDEYGNTLIDSRGEKMYDYGDGAVMGLERPFMSMANPINATAIDTDESLSDMISGKAFAEITFLKDFKATVNAGVDIDNTRYRIMANPFYGQFASMNGYVQVDHGRKAALNLQQLLTWSRDFDKHHVDVLAGHENYRYRISNLSAYKTKLYNYDVPEVDNAINSPNAGSKSNEYFTEGYFLRAQYDFDHKYFFSGSYRRDASSRFHPDNRWGNFWSVGASWLMSSESFLKDVKWVDMLKIKASYGSQGNDNILLSTGLPNYYPYLDQYKLLNNAGEFALSLYYKGNKNLKWETNYNFNTGVEFGFFGNRLTGSIEYFVRKAQDLLFDRPVAPNLGYASYPDNIGDMRNTGFEFELHGTAIDTKNFRWTVFVNGSHYKNKILSLPPENMKNGLVSGSFKRTVGGSIYDYYMREWAGVDAETGAALWSLIESDGTKTTTTSYEEATEMLIGKSAIPDLYGGFGTTFEFYGVDLGINFTYQIGGWAYDVPYANLMHTGDAYSLGRNWHKDILNAWTPENTSSSVPIVDRGAYTANRSSRFLTKASYLNIQNITIGYTLPKSFTDKLGIGSVRIYGVADNVALFSKRKGFDPRFSFTGIGSYGAYSPIRTISGGIQLTF